MLDPAEIRALHPTSQPNDGVPVDPVEIIAAEQRPAPADRPWILTNMVASIDGGTAVDGLSADLGGPADLAVFLALRAVADLIIVGAATAVAEAYKPPRPTEQVVTMRRERGQATRPTIVVVTSSLSIGANAPLFSEPDYRPVLLTVDDAPADRVEALSAVADIVQAGVGQVDLAAGLAALRNRGAIALLEGGPTLNGHFVDSDLIDEWNQTISPMLIAGSSHRPAVGTTSPQPVPLHLDRLWSADGLLFGRWLRANL